MDKCFRDTAAPSTPHGRELSSKRAAGRPDAQGWPCSGHPQCPSGSAAVGPAVSCLAITNRFSSVLRILEKMTSVLNCESTDLWASVCFSDSTAQRRASDPEKQPGCTHRASKQPGSPPVSPAARMHSSHTRRPCTRTESLWNLILRLQKLKFLHPTVLFHVSGFLILG